MNDMIRIHPSDSVAVALKPVTSGTECEGVCVLEDILQGHKVALQNIAAGENVIKYGFPIGHATRDIKAGEWVHTHNMATNLRDVCDYSYHPVAAKMDKKISCSFQGYRRQDGKVGVRNEIWIIPTVGCVNDVAKALAKENQHLVKGSIDGLYAFPHPFGCSQTGKDHENTRRLLASLCCHPNAGAVLVLGLGCENLTEEQFKQELGCYDPKRIRFVICQQVEDEMEAGRAALERCAVFASQFQRESVPVSELVIGMKCGGSDGLSGITANPAVGLFSDTLIQQGGSTVLTEVPEMFGAEDMLMNRCVNQEVFEKAVSMINGFKEYFIRHQENVYENPSPGNKMGGITTLEDKSCGCVQKGGSAPVADVIAYGERVQTKGLNMLCGPGNDLVSATALTAAGAQIVLFTTGRGTPFGAPAPTIKIATNTSLFARKRHWLDFNSGMIADGTATMAQNAEALFDHVLRVASGEKTCSEGNGYREIAIFKDGVML